jgi:hypothetical protein
MIMSKVQNWVIIVLLILITHACRYESDDNSFSLLNTAHLDHLYEELIINNQSIAIIHIYADYPDYDWVDAPGEGTACIDDIARSAVFYLAHSEHTGQKKSLYKAKRLLESILFMQAPNGLFYNFINPDYTINKSHRNSQPKANWWTWRALWALAEALPYYSTEDPAYANRLNHSIERTFLAIDSILMVYPDVRENHGIIQPTWLPLRTASDQAAVLQMALLAYLRHKSDPSVRERIRKISEGISQMQAGDSANYPFGAFLSWDNLWHAYGNSQAYSLLLSGHALGMDRYIQAGLLEINSFHPYLISRNYLNEFSVIVAGDQFVLKKEKQYAQIAYGIRPLVWANLQAYKITGRESYARQGADIACWLIGKNRSDQLIYDPQTGRCFDGLEDDHTINKNCGAESTVEALLALLEVEKNKISRSVLHKYYLERANL